MEPVLKDKNYTKEYDSVKEFVTNFFTYYYTERNCDKVVEAFSEDIVFVGLSTDVVAHDKDTCRHYIEIHINEIPKPVPYFLMDYSQRKNAYGVWDCFAFMELNVVSSGLGTTRYNLRVTLSVCRENEQWKIIVAHVSESSSLKNRKGEFHYRSPEAKNSAQRELGRIMSQVVPGGIVSRYVSKGAPVSIINVEGLNMMHHETFYDFMEDCGGFWENVIHPEDQDKFQRTAKFIVANNKQCECDYRIRRSDGGYIWVHDVGRKAVSTDGKDLLVSVLTDMSEHMQQREKLKQETETDALTSLYNRRGAMNHLQEWKNDYNDYAIIMMDIDNFKQVNDLYGHKQGDNVLKYLADLLSSQFGDNGIVCRQGGDEFSVFLPDFKDREKLYTDLDQIRQIFVSRMGHACPDANASLSIGGIYGKKPFDTMKAFDSADSNMYRVKKTCKNGICLTESVDQTE